MEAGGVRIELAALINLPPGTAYTLAEPPAGELTPRFADIPIDQMEEAAVATPICASISTTCG